ncbi:MAG: flippase-like domain-containing protein [Clostridiales bacterium]|nr:flippase-like domain-containing protein [Clostridiales bacterium]
MAKKRFIFKNLFKYKKASLNQGQFFSDQHLLKNQISFDDLKEQGTFDEQEIASRISENNQTVVKQKSKKKKILSLVFFLINIGVVAGILINQLTHAEVEPIANLLNGLRWEYLLLIVVVFVAVQMLDAGRTTMLLRQSTKREGFALSYKMVAIGKYWDAATPLSAGEPFQVFYLNKFGVDADTAISVPTARYVLFQMSWMLVGIFSIIYASRQPDGGSLVSIAAYVGFALNTLLLVGTIFLSVSKKTGKILVVKILKLLQKMRIIKNYEAVYDKVMDTVAGFQNTMIKYTKKLGKFILMILMFIFQLILNYSGPYLIYLAFGGAPSFDLFLKMSTYTVLIDLASCFVPLPGGTGVNEISFTFIFASMFKEKVVWALIFWRFLSHYIYLIQGIFLMGYDYIWGNKKYEWKKKQRQLESESNKFKEKQLREYKKRVRSGKIRI